MKTYYVTYKVDARYTAEIHADSLDEARKQAEGLPYDASFGDAQDIDVEPIIIEDENGSFVWEK